MSRRVLVTGATSSLGRRLVQQLLACEKTELVLAIGAEPRPGAFDQARVRYCQVDLLKSRQLANLFRSRAFADEGVDTVVHLAFHRRPDMDVDAIHALNVIGTQAILDWSLQASSVRKFVFRSSGMVYRVGPQNPVQLAEDDPLDFEPHCHPVVRDEVNSDMLCQLAMRWTGTRVVILRPTNVVGPDLHSFLGSWVDAALALSVLGWNPLVNVMSVDDLATALVAAVDRDVSGVFNVGGIDTLTMADVARLAGTPLLPVPERALATVNRSLRRLGATRFRSEVSVERLKYSWLLDTRRAREELGFSPQHPVRFAEIKR